MNALKSDGVAELSFDTVRKANDKIVHVRHPHRALVVHSDKMTKRDWYVALTRATNGLTILSPSETITPTA
jgi:hypothetical protein